jgi:hypothetical protein
MILVVAWGEYVEERCQSNKGLNWGAFAAIAVAALVSACTQMAGTGGPTTAAPSQMALAPTETKCNRLRTERYQLQAYQQARANRSTVGRLAGPVLLSLLSLNLAIAATTSDAQETQSIKARIDMDDAELAAEKCSPNPAVLEQSAEQRSQTSGKYGGRGKTESWCQTPTISMVLDSGRLKGTLSETVDRNATSDIVGNITPDGVLQIQFDGKAERFFTGDIDADFKDGVMSIFLRPNAKCTYTFVLERNKTTGVDVPAADGRAPSLGTGGRLASDYKSH